MKEQKSATEPEKAEYQPNADIQVQCRNPKNGEITWVSIRVLAVLLNCQMVQELFNQSRVRGA